VSCVDTIAILIYLNKIILFQFNPSMPEIFALASYNKSSACYLDPRAQLLCVLEGQKGGITQIEFSPDGTKLFAGGRKDNEILIWDMRNPGMLYAVLNREVNTNQRIYFDIESSGRYVFSGNTDGSVSVWDLDQSVDTSGQNGQLDTVAHFQKYSVIRSCHFQSISCS
jgi:WD40 repeat protein